MNYSIELFIDVEGYCYQYNVTARGADGTTHSVHVVPLPESKFWPDQALRAAMARVPTFP